MRRSVLVSVLLLLAAIGYVEMRLPVGVGAQGGDAVYTRVAVTSPAGGRDPCRWRHDTRA